jgi:hypothetical protein
VLIVSAWFVGAVLIMPAASFLSRALFALAAAVASAASVLLLFGGSVGRIDGRIADQVRAGSQEVGGFWSRVGSAEFQGQLADAVARATEVQIMLYPALLALATISGLAVAWWALKRMTATEEAPLRPLREFSFNDGLVWVLICGVALYLLPAQDVAARAGTNLIAFMGALYALRGLAVIVVLAGMPGPLGWLIGVVIALLLYPFVVATTFFVGLIDTWLHLRSRRVAAADGGKTGGTE